MLLRRSAVLLLMLLPAGWAQTVRLRSGEPWRFSIGPKTSPFFLTGITVAVPPGSTRLTINLEADGLANDINLYARFSQDITVQGSTATGTDFSSLGPGIGLEKIVIAADTTPPLQTGTYYLAIGVVTLNTLINGAITATVEGGAAAGTFIVSTFDFDSDGWRSNFPASTLPAATVGDPGVLINWSSAGGMPGGYLSLIEPSGAPRDFLVVPGKFLGNLGALSNPRIEFDYRLVSAAEPLFPIIVRILGHGSAFEWTSPENPSASWKHYQLPLNEETFRLASGTATLAQALSNVQRIELSMDQSLGAETIGIDNFTLAGDRATRLTTPPLIPVTSNFESQTDGWSRNYPPVGVAGATVGDPESALSLSGGTLVYNEAGFGAGDFFVAPAKFLGNLAVIQNPQLEFDYRQAAGQGGAGPVVVRLLGAGASYRWGGPVPFALSQRYQIPLSERFFVRESGTAMFNETLAAVERMEISADQSTGEEINILDNVTLVSAAAPPVQASLAAAPATLTFAATAGGVNPAARGLFISSSGDTVGLKLNWTGKLNPEGSWLSLSLASGTTPSTLQAAVNIANLAPGTYNGSITVTAPGALNTPQTVAVTLTVSPGVPRITAGGVGNAANSRGPIAAGSLAVLYGINLSPSEGSPAFLPGTQTLPPLFRGVRVLLRDPGGVEIAAAPLTYVSNTQINFQMPLEVGARASVALVVDNNGLLSPAETVALAPTAPGLFLHQGNRGVAQNQDLTLNGASNAAPRGSAIIAYLTGQGPVSVAVPTGQAAPLSPLALATSTAAASIGGVPATVLFLGLTPGLVGVAQANILVGPSTPAGEQILLISLGGQTANGGVVSIRE